jgi:hypothetical protein
MTTEFDATAGAEGWDVVIAGTGFTGDASTVSFEVGGTAQTGTEVTATQAKFRVSDVTSGTLASPFLYFPVGLPAEHALVAAGATLEPRLTQISPNVGSVGGTEIIATVHGVGTATEGLDLIDRNGDSICQTLTITAYSVVKCVTKATDLGEDRAIRVKLGTARWECAATDTTKCAYTQSAAGASSFPAITSVAKGSGTTVVFTGTAFYTVGYTASASFMGVAADSVV